MKNSASYGQKLLLKALGRKAFQTIPAVFFCLLLSVTVYFTMKRSSGNRDSVVVNTNMGVVKKNLNFLLDAKSNSIDAEFKGTKNNADGSVDLVFRVIGKPQPTRAAIIADPPIKPAEVAKKSITYSVFQPKNTNQSFVRSEDQVPNATYPLTLTSDFLINTITVCPEGKPIDYVIVVHSATAYFKRRRDIRDTYGGPRVIGTVSQSLVFMLGTTSDPVTTRLIQQEALQYGDIVQGRFRDSYHNLTHKAVMGLRWVASHCSQAKIIVKIDDDTFINTFKLVDEILPEYSSLKRHIACQVRPPGTSKIQRGKSKWHVGEDEFKGYKHYPFPYCNGYFVIITQDLMYPLLQAAYVNPFFWIDDVYAFGLLPQTVGNVTFAKLSHNLTLKYDIGKNCLQSEGLDCKFLAVSNYKPSGMETMWYSLLGKMSDSTMKKYKLFNSS